MLDILHMGTEPTRPDGIVPFENREDFFILQLPVDNLISLTDLVSDATHFINTYAPHWLMQISNHVLETELRYAVYAASPSWLHISPEPDIVESYAWFLISLER